MNTTGWKRVGPRCGRANQTHRPLRVWAGHRGPGKLNFVQYVLTTEIIFPHAVVVNEFFTRIGIHERRSFGNAG